MRTLALAGLLLAIGLIAGILMWRSAPEPEPVTLTVGTGHSGGVYYTYGLGLEEATAGTATPVQTRSTPASVANLRMVHTGQLDAGFTMADVAALAVNGEAPFSEVQDIRAVARLYDNHTHLVVPADSHVEQVSDLSGQRVSVGAADSGTEMVANRLLEGGGLAGTEDGGDVDRVQLDLEDAAEALIRGQIDALFWSGGLPTEAVSDLATRMPVRLVDLSVHVPHLAERYGDYFLELPVPAGTYPDVPPVRTLGVPNLLVVHKDMSEEVAF